MIIKIIFADFTFLMSCLIGLSFSLVAISILALVQRGTSMTAL
jgi:hypothetical protein